MRRFGILALLLVALPAGAQYQTRPWLQWHTLETPRFAFHFPLELGTWTEQIAGRMEAIDSAVSGIVGYSPRKRVDVIVDDPFRVPNGSAWPLLNHPTLVLWASPPDPREDIGNYTTWGDMLTSHEFAHLAHLTRPSRNPLVRAIWKLSPAQLGPIAVKSPRWVIEGYATHVEGIVTGSGRPHGYWRAAVLRQWAIEGNLPNYDQLDVGNGMYGGEFAYLAGSAFLEWLVARRGEQSLRDLWARMSARENRGFVAAFVGVYGEAPSLLYDRFVADLTADAMRVAAAMRTADSGTAIQHLGRETGDPAFSGDGSRAAIMLAPGFVPPRIVVWNTAATPDTVSARFDRKLLERDPQDVPPVRLFPPAKRAIATLRAVAGQPYRDPRFFPDGRILVWRNSAVGDGSYTPDLYIWNPRKQLADRLTKHRNLRQADVSPDGSAIAALRCVAGKCDVVVLPSRPGTIRLLAAGNETRSFARPRFAADGKSILVAAHDSAVWRAARIDLASGTLQFLSPGGVNVFEPVEANDSTVVATAVLDGIPTIVKLRAGGEMTPLVHVTGAAAGPEIDRRTGTVWFLAMHSRGWDVRATNLDHVSARIAIDSATLALPPIDTPRFLPRPAKSSWGRYTNPLRVSWFPGGQFTTDSRGGPLLGLNITDVVGRHDLLGLVQPAKAAAWHGSSATITSRAHPVISTLSVYDVWREAQFMEARQRGGMIAFDASRRVELAASRLVIGGSRDWRSVPLDPTCSSDSGRNLDGSTLSGPACPGFSTVRRSSAFAYSSLGVSSYTNDVRTGVSLSGLANVTRLGNATSRVFIGSGILDLPGLSLSATAASTNATDYNELLMIGGPVSPLTSPWLTPQLLPMPAIPMGVELGNHAVTGRASLPLGPSLRAYQWFGRAWTYAPLPHYMSVRGVEWTAGLPRIPTLGIPSSRLNAGFGFWADALDGRLVYTNWNTQPGAVFYPRTRSRYSFYVSTQFGDWVR